MTFKCDSYFPYIHHGSSRRLKRFMSLSIWCNGKLIGHLRAWLDEEKQRLCPYQFHHSGGEITKDAAVDIRQRCERLGLYPSTTYPNEIDAAYAMLKRIVRRG